MELYREMERTKEEGKEVCRMWQWRGGECEVPFSAMLGAEQRKGSAC